LDRRLHLERYNITGVAEFAAEMKAKDLGIPKVSLQFELSNSGITRLVKAEAAVEEIYTVTEEEEVDDDEEEAAEDEKEEEVKEEAAAEEAKEDSTEEAEGEEKKEVNETADAEEEKPKREEKKKKKTIMVEKVSSDVVCIPLCT
jgi:hypothetical protein